MSGGTVPDSVHARLPEVIGWLADCIEREESIQAGLTEEGLTISRQNHAALTAVWRYATGCDWRTTT